MIKTDEVSELVCPVDPEIKRLVVMLCIVVVVLVLIVWLVRVLGIPDIRVP